MNHSTYVSLFKTIADTNLQLQHTHNFFRITNAMGPIGAMLDIDEIVKAQKVGFDGMPFMILESYAYNFTDNAADNYNKKIEGAFFIMDIPTIKGDPTQIENVYSATEQIVDDVCSWLKKYFAKPPIAYTSVLDINSFMVEKVGPFGLGYYGNRCAFHFEQSATDALAYDASKWSANP